MSYLDMTRNIDNASQTGLSNAMRIVRTEGHRIQQASWHDSAVNAKAHGADLVRVWSAVLDGNTRDTHRQYDGARADVDKPFNLNGREVMMPGYFGIPAEDCNCRCRAKSVPRWALDDGFSKYDNFTGEIREFNSPEDYEDFKKKYWSKENLDYMKHIDELEKKYGTSDFESLLIKMDDREYQKLKKLEDASPIWKSQEKERQWGIQYGVDAQKVNWDYINSEQFKQNIYGITDNDNANKAIYDAAIEALKHCDGTDHEDMYLFSKDGAVLGKVTDSVSKNGINYSDEFREIVNQNKGKNPIALHNHPEGTPPSPDDFKKAFENRYGQAIVIGNNGQIYVYANESISLTSEEVEAMSYDIQYLYSLGFDIDRAANEVYNGYGLKYQIIKIANL